MSEWKKFSCSEKQLEEMLLSKNDILIGYIMIQRIEEDTSPRRISSAPKNRRLLLYWPKCGEHYSGRWYTGEWRHGQFMCDANLEVPVNHHPTYWTELPELPKE